MDRGAWWATVHGVMKSLTPPKRLSMMVTLIVSAPNVTESYPKRCLERQILQDRRLSIHTTKEKHQISWLGDSTQPPWERACVRGGGFCLWGVARIFGKVTMVDEGDLERGGEHRAGREMGGPGSGLGGCIQGLAAGRGQRSPGWDSSGSHWTPPQDNPTPNPTLEPHTSSLRSTDHLSGPGK